MARHPEANKLYKEGFFTGIKSFKDFEALIDAKIPIPDPSDDTPLESDKWPKKKGDVFEVFAEAYLVLKKGYQYMEVWPFAASPVAVQKDLNIPCRDKGIDIIARNQTPEVQNLYDAVQVKFRSGRRSLSYKNLGTFFGLTDSAKIGAKIVFTNSDYVSQDAEDRDKYQKIGPALLDALTEEDFRLIEEYVSTGRIGKLKRTRKPHQEDAVKALREEFGKATRAQAIMACGSGKTMVCMWTAEELKAKTIVLFLPSLALVGQTMHEWTRYTSIPRLLTLCVCSDETIAADSESDDELTDEQRDLDFKVTTNSDEVERFLMADFPGVKIVFSTYKSAHVVAKGMPDGFSFDFGIFDEAHKTVGLVNKEHAFALNDRNLKITRRLFATATPRRRKASKDRDGFSDEVYSMHDAEVYGRRAYYLPFNEAAKQGIICKYKVIVTVVTSGEVSDKIQAGSLSVDVDGVSVSGGRVLGRLALESAIKKSGARKVITFHQRIGEAEAFAKYDETRHGSFFPGFFMAHISGKMRSDQRKGIIDSFRDSEQGILTNARCLTEGVDLPAVDMVAFLSRKKSRVDIIQAIGRSLRIPTPNLRRKDTGYVLVPLFVELKPGMTLMDAIELAGYDEIWDVLNALADYDDDLEAAIRKTSVGRARYRKVNFSALRDYIEVVADLSEIRDSVISKCIDSLELPWDQYYGRLLAYFDAHGNIDVQSDTTENEELVYWMYLQRSRRSKGGISEADIQKLDAIGFVWDKFDDQWNSMYAKARLYKELNNDFDVTGDDDDSKKLRTWLTRQRTKLKSDALSKSQKELLDQIGFDWDVLDERWEESFAALEKIYRERSTCELPDEPEFFKLNIWIKNQRQNYRKGKLSPARLAKLKRINFIWNTRDSSWMGFYQRLEEFKQLHGDCNVPEGYKADPKLAAWVSNNRHNPPKDPERLRLLNEIGFAFSFRDDAWEVMIASLAVYRDTHKDCAVPIRYSDEPKLGKWVSNLRVLRRKGKLSADRVAQLSAMGFVWSVKPSPVGRRTWDESYDALSKFHAIEANADVPTDYPADPSLPKWIQRQRENKIKGLLSLEQIVKLEKLGFVWDILESKWTASYKLLVDFKNVKGHCMVPRGYPVNPALALWVTRQRKAYRNKTISEARVMMLNRLNFEWMT